MSATKGRGFARWSLVAIYAVAGIIHIRKPSLFMRVMPDVVPYPREVIVATGACEIAGAVGLMLPKTRRLAGRALALYAVCVFPVNIKHAVLQSPVGGVRLNGWYHGPRLLFQPVFVWWALVAGRR